MYRAGGRAARIELPLQQWQEEGRASWLGEAFPWACLTRCCHPAGSR